MLPRLDGLALIDRIRARGVGTPVLILSARRSVDDRVKGLQAGADDYLTKPFAFAELLNVEARALQADGIDIVQFDEPAFNVYMSEAADWGVAALERAAEGLTCKTAVHICYGYGIDANRKWKDTLGH